jgi:hypothetical protein
MWWHSWIDVAIGGAVLAVFVWSEFWVAGGDPHDHDLL